MAQEKIKVETKEFQAEVKKLLDIVIHSLYTEREIFVRELISNAADALEKFRHQSLLEEEVFDSHVPLEITIEADDKNHTLTITDTGIGMTREELEANLGTIAHSGSRTFFTQLAEAARKDVNLIGQFGVGFYAAFMAGKRVRVISRSYRPTAEGCEWASDGAGSYTLTPAPGTRRGTKIIVELKEDAHEFADKMTLQRIIRKYSNFVSFPIMLAGETVNTVQALWARSRQEIKEEEYTEFYKFIGNAVDEPFFRLHFSADAPLAINALLFVPKDNFESLGFGRMKSGVNLYCQKVLIEQHSENILPEWLRFLKGVVDSEDLPLNISRQALQDSNLVAKLRKVLTKRFLKFLEEQAVAEQERYLEFWKNFGMFLKEGATADFAYRDEIAKLLRFESSRSEAGQPIALADYVGRMAEGQQEIYYINGPNRAAIESGPYVEAFLKREIEILYLFEPIDDFVMSHVAEFDAKKLVSADRADLKLPEKQPDQAAAGKDEDAALAGAALTGLTDWMQEVLGSRVKAVTESKRLEESPAMVVNPDSFMTSTMERVLQAAHLHQGKAAQEFGGKNLEINSRHALIKNLPALKQKDESLAREVVEQIFDNALIQAGLVVDSRKMVERTYHILERIAVEVQ
ncbi:MAG: molecular chaperone HtpG [Deltaproteobacteria bacterium RIFOXYD12_FULL_57_12]|nr:MAG: molecular chaperone HtpG [Deltaproteobacteria bacterium RIFOXYD12_FULL_57_12]